MHTQFVSILVFLVIGALIVPLILFIGRLLRPHHPDPKKLTTYECGEIPIGGSWIQFNLRFYVIAILFLIFAVEIAFMFPIAVVFKQWMSQNGLIIFAEIMLFIGILLMGLAYAWIQGDLEWIRLKKPKTKEN